MRFGRLRESSWQEGRFCYPCIGVSDVALRERLGPSVESLEGPGGDGYRAFKHDARYAHAGLTAIVPSGRSICVGTWHSEGDCGARQLLLPQPEQLLPTRLPEPGLECHGRPRAFRSLLRV